MRITPVESLTHFQDTLSTLPDLRASLPLLPRADEISASTRQGVSDCLYVALAEREGCAPLTADTKLIVNLQATFPCITAPASLYLNSPE